MASSRIRSVIRAAAHVSSGCELAQQIREPKGYGKTYITAQIGFNPAGLAGHHDHPRPRCRLAQLPPVREAVQMREIRDGDHGVVILASNTVLRGRNSDSQIGSNPMPCELMPQAAAEIDLRIDQ